MCHAVTVLNSKIGECHREASERERGIEGTRFTPGLASGASYAVRKVCSGQRERAPGPSGTKKDSKKVLEAGRVG